MSRPDPAEDLIGGHAIAFVDVSNQLAHACDVTRELVADGEGRAATVLRPLVPVVDVHVGAAHAGATHANQHFVVADLGDGNVAHRESGTCDCFD